MRNSKQCPKCSSKEIYTNEGISKRGERSIIPITSWSSIYVNVFACADCGYFEEHLDTKDKTVMEKLKSNWKKV